MGRPRKSEDERMRQLWVHLPPDLAEAIERAARLKDVHVSHVVRRLVEVGYQTLKTKPAESSLTL